MFLNNNLFLKHKYMDITLINFMNEQLDLVDLGFKRYMYDKLPWESRLVGLTGPRGVGKSTIIMQHIKEMAAEDRKKTLYVSADHSYFTIHTLTELASQFVREGGEWLYIDEVHKYNGWSKELKQIYDSHPALHTFFTGSSVLDILEGEADLSRRSLLFNMQGLSFREYLKLFHDIDTPIYSMDEVLRNKAEIPGVAHPLPLFRSYLHNGYYPFGRDPEFDLEMLQVINQTMEVDIPQYLQTNVSIGRKLKSLLMVVARSVPFKPVMTKLAEVTGISRNDVSDYLIYIEQAGMISQLRDRTGGIRGLGKVEKLYLDNPNLIYVLEPDKADVGNIRETFFMNQTRVTNDVISSKISDFEIDGRTFEIGGKNKGKKQIENAGKGYVVKDDIETGYANVIPIWAFGLLY